MFRIIVLRRTKFGYEGFEYEFFMSTKIQITILRSVLIHIGLSSKNEPTPTYILGRFN